MIGLHPDLRKHLALVFIVSMLLAIVGFAALFVWARSLLAAEHARSGLLVFGIAAFAVAYLGLAALPRWYRRASFVVATERPRAGAILLAREVASDTTLLYAEYEGERYTVIKPRWPVETLLGKHLDAHVYIDPRSGSPAAFRVGQGLLWCVPTNRRSG
jgi:hypothetical protein